MLRLLQWLIFGHIHEYEIVETKRVTQGEDRFTTYILRCKHCGKMKHYDAI